PHRPEGVPWIPSLHHGREGEEGQQCEHRPAGHLRRGVEREPPLKQTRARPGERRQGDVDPPQSSGGQWAHGLPDHTIYLSTASSPLPWDDVGTIRESVNPASAGAPSSSPSPMRLAATLRATWAGAGRLLAETISALELHGYF